MAARKQPEWLHVAISWGASIVIIGVLAKIIHWGGAYANLLIAIGLGVEAILFFLTGLYPPDSEIPEATVPAAAPAQNIPSSATLDKMLSDAAMATNDFAAKITNAGQGFDQLNSAFAKATSQLVEMGENNIDIKAYHEQVNDEVAKLAKNLAALNAVYGKMLTAMNQH